MRAAMGYGFQGQGHFALRSEDLSEVPMQPFSITLFATTGDPEGIRHLDKSNWSGYGVFFNRVLNSTQRTEREKRRNARLDRRLSEGHAQEDKAGNRANTGGKGKKNPNRMRVGISHYGGSGGTGLAFQAFPRHRISPCFSVTYACNPQNLCCTAFPKVDDSPIFLMTIL